MDGSSGPDLPDRYRYRRRRRRREQDSQRRQARRPAGAASGEVPAGRHS